MELITAQSIYYSNREPLPIEDVVSSLLALKTVLSATPDIFEKLEPGLHIRDIRVYIDEVRTGSLIEDLIIKFTWGTQEALLADVDKVRKKLRVQAIMENKKLLGCIIGAIVLVGGYHLLSKSNATPEQKATIEANNNTIINIGAEMTQMSPEQFKSIIESVVLKDQNLQKAAARVVQPAKRESGTSITFNENPTTSINASTVVAMPSIVTDDDEPEYVEDYENVEIQIRAFDLDSVKRGWAAVVPSVHSRRAKMHLDPHIKGEDLLRKKSIKGDVSVVFKFDDSGKKYPSLIFLRDVKK